MSRSDWSGWTASTASALASSTATQPGPLSTHWASTTWDGCRLSTSTRWSRVFSSTGAEVRVTPVGQQGVPSAERRMTGERELPARREDPHPVVGPGRLRRQDERGLGQVRSTREALHLLGTEPLGVHDDCDGVAQVGLFGEHINLAEWALHGDESGTRPSAGAGDFLPHDPRLLPSRRGDAGPPRGRARRRGTMGPWWCPRTTMSILSGPTTPLIRRR